MFMIYLLISNSKKNKEWVNNFFTYKLRENKNQISVRVIKLRVITGVLILKMGDQITPLNLIISILSFI